jgi:hypothetical protein
MIAGGVLLRNCFSEDEEVVPLRKGEGGELVCNSVSRLQHFRNIEGHPFRETPDVYRLTLRQKEFSRFFFE